MTQHINHAHYSKRSLCLSLSDTSEASEATWFFLMAWLKVLPVLI
jgi:hypothetical protein